MSDNAEFIPKSFPTNLLQKDWAKRKFYLHENEIAVAQKLHDMEVREDDIWLVTLPNSGDKFMQEIIWLILNNYDYGGAKKENLIEKSQHYEINENLEKTLLSAESLKSPRLITTHLPLPMLPEQVWRKTPKLIYVYRDPKDAQVSFYLDNRNKEITKNKSCEEYLSDNMDNNSSFEHVNEFYVLRNKPWVFYTSFERMVSNLSEVITEVVQFLEKSITGSQMERMLQYFSNDDIKSNPKNGFLLAMDKLVRKVKRIFERQRFQSEEKIGISKTELSPEFYAKFEKWIEDELKKYNVTLFELLLIDEDANQNSNESNGKDNEKGEINDSDDSKKVVDEDNTLIEDSNNVEAEKNDVNDNVEVEEKKVDDVEKDDIDNVKVQKEDSTINLLVVNIDGDSTEFEKKDDKDNAEFVEININDNEKFENNNSKDNEEIVINDSNNVNEAEKKENNRNDNDEVEKLEINEGIFEKMDSKNEEVEMKGNNDTLIEVEEIRSNDNEIVKNEQTINNEEVTLNDGNDSENLEKKDTESDKAEKKESEDADVQSTHL